MKFFVLFVFFFSFDSTAFSFRDCGRTFSGKGAGMNGQIFWGLIDTTSSSAQFTTSTGNCAAIGMTQEEKAQSFYAFNQDKVLEDIAKSKGEYLASFERILGCKMELSDLRKNYSVLTSIEIEGQYEVVRKSCVTGKVN